MRILGTTKGIVLLFESIPELKATADHLHEQANWVEQEGIEPPYVYAQFDDRIPAKEIEILLDGLKKYQFKDILP